MGRTSDANERLMKAIIELIWEESYGTVTIDDICSRADVKKGSFYYFFDSKSSLAIAAIQRLWTEEWKPRFDALFSPTVEPLDRITRYLEHLYKAQSEHKLKTGRVPGCPICSLGSEMNTQDRKLCEKVREIFGYKRRYFESAIRDAIGQGLIEACDPVEKVASLVALIEGVLSQGRIMNDPEIIRRLPKMASDILREKPKVPVHA